MRLGSSYFIFFASLGAIALMETNFALAGDACGQSSGGKGVNPRIGEAATAREKFCGPEMDLKSLAEKCKGDGEGDKAVTEDAGSFKDKAEQLCKSSKDAIAQAQKACDANRAAADRADKFNADMAALKGDQSQRQLPYSHGLNTMQIATALGNASGLASHAGAKVGDEVKKTEGTKEDLDKLNEAPVKQNQLRAKKAADAERVHIKCNSNSCEGPTRAAAKKANQTKREVAAACKDLMAAKKKLEEMQKDLKEKLEKLKEGVEQLATEALDKGKALNSGAATDAAREAKLDSTGEKVPQANAGADAKPDPEKRTSDITMDKNKPKDALLDSKIVRESWDLPIDKTGIKPPGKVGDVQEAGASWYDPTGRLAGQKSDSLTAASNYFPKGSILEVTNLDNGKTTTVRVNDDGVFRPNSYGYSKDFSSYGESRGVGIDLSRQAAREIGIERSGLGRVRIRRIR